MNYPIKDTDRFTIFDTNTNSPFKNSKDRPLTNEKWGSNDFSKMVPNLEPNIKWLINAKETTPEYDSSTHRLESETVYDVENETATLTYNVTALSEEEINSKIPPHYETSGGIKMGVKESDQNSFANLLTLLNASGSADNDNISIKDINGVAHPITVAEYKTIVVQYGLYCYSLFLA